MIAKIALFSNVRMVFDYKIPENLKNHLHIATRVLIPFGKRQKETIGLIIAIVDHSLLPAEKLKFIISSLDPTPIIPAMLYQALTWAANYYKNPLGGMLDCALPKYLKENKVPKNHTSKSPNIKLSIQTTNVSEIKLTTDQQRILDQLLTKQGTFKISLLQGVTGSGKTEIYLRLTAAMLAQNKQTLILIPEIGLTPQTWQIFTDRFKGVELAIVHSELGEKQRYLNWLKAKAGTAKIILGTRSAAFAPLPDLGLIIIDEEHDLSFKQQEYLNYMARDFLLMRAKLANCPILLGTATPSLETLYNVQLNKYDYYALPMRAKSKLPAINIVDLRGKKLSTGLADPTIKAIEKHLAADKQVLIFINRRGFAPTLKCVKCKFIKTCKFCDANMTWHVTTNKLHCHHCSETSELPSICPNCNQEALILMGRGTQRLEKALQKQFPTAKIARIDQDSTKRSAAFPAILEEILTGKVNLLIGTQMLAKGHHFPKLTLVVIIDLDHALFGSDFRATERLGQLILQVAGRAGREQEGEVLLQTAYPTNPLIQAIAKYDYLKFGNILLSERKAAGLPPFSHQILWRVEGAKLANCMLFLTDLKNLATNMLMAANFKSSVKMLGPIPALMEKRKKKFHARLLFQSADRNWLQTIHDRLITAILDGKIANSNNISWMIDVDPKEI